MKTMKTLAVAVALVASVGAQAAVTFNFQAASTGTEASYHPSKTFTSGGITVTAIAGSTVDLTPGVWQDVKGLGVSDEDFRGEIDYNYNDSQRGESLTFSFNQLVTIGNYGLEDWVDFSHRATISWGGGSAGAGSLLKYGEGDISDAHDIFSIAIPGSIQWLKITPENRQGGGNTNFYVYQLGNINAAPTPPPAVPVPAAAWLMGSALVGLSAVARRRRA
jgi:hypothetical protein